jgi:rod shape-determining protein MreB
MPCGASAIEEDAILRTAAAAGGGQVFAVAEPIAAALGVGLPIEESCGSMIVDIGGGSTTVSVVSLSGIVVSSTCATGGGYLDWLIVEHVRRTKGVLIGESTAEHIKMTLGTAVQHAHVRSMKVQGQNAKTGLPATAEIFESDVVEAFGDCLHEIARLIEEILDRTPPELAADLMDTGAILVGGGALLQDIDLFLSEKTGLPMTLAEDPATATITGCGQILEQWQKYKHLLLDH